MRIAYLVSQYPAASHTFIRREIEALRARGLDIATYSVRPPSESERVASWDRAAFEDTTYLLPTRLGVLVAAHVSAMIKWPLAYLSTLRLALDHRAAGAKALLWSLFHFAEAVVLAHALRRDKIDHVHNHFANAGATVGLLATHLVRIPWSLTLHGISETDYPAGLLLARKIAAAKFVACVSWFGQAQAMRITPPVHWHKMSIVRCGLNLIGLEPAIGPELKPADDIRIVCVGRLSPEKGHLGLLDAFAGLRSHGVIAQLVLVGDGPERAAIKQHAATLQLGDTVLFKGQLGERDTLAEIRRASLLVLPSFMEGLPIVLMEAMALGVPLVASRVAGIPELVEDGVEGLLFRPSDWSDLRDKMTMILTDDVLSRRFSAAARAKVEAQFDINRVIDPLIEQLALTIARVVDTPMARAERSASEGTAAGALRGKLS